MGKHARLPAIDRARDAGAAEVPLSVRSHPLYYAFLSYSHRDGKLADWLHRELEGFRVPPALAGKLTANGVIPRKLAPIFRDEHELAAADDLGEEIEAALAASRFLVVLCSPDAAKSRWTNAEIESFKRAHPDGCVLAVIAAGEPFASEIPGREDEECFPTALRQKYDRRGRPTGKRAEPLAADLRAEGDGRRLGLLKLIAGMLGIGLDELVQRETARRQRRLAWLTAASLAGMGVTSGLAVTAIQARDAARDQRREAEGLIGFMLGDLKNKLEPIGKLDALDGVGARVLAYYQKLDTSELSDAALLQRSRALSLMGEVAILRGDLDGASRLYQEAAAGTAEAIRRDPDDPQRLYDHAQNQFYFGDIAMSRGHIDSAEAAFREYKRLADRMVELAPDNMKWRMEVQNADANLATVLSKRRRFNEAATQWAQAYRMIEALATADPNNRDYQQSLVESIAWYADAEMDAGHLDGAIALRLRNVDLLTRLANRTQDVNYEYRLILAERALGNLYASQDRMDLALEHMRTAVAQADRLAQVEPGNAKWLGYGAKAKNDLADLLLRTGALAEARGTNEAACAIVARLLSRVGNQPGWRAGLRDCWILRSQLAHAGGSKTEAVSDSERSVEIAKTVKGTDQASDRYLLAKAYRVLGDMRRSADDGVGASAAWQAALTALPSVSGERPSEIRERAEIYRRLGRDADAQLLEGKLAAIGYKSAIARTQI